MDSDSKPKKKPFVVWEDSEAHDDVLENSSGDHSTSSTTPLQDIGQAKIVAVPIQSTFPNDKSVEEDGSFTQMSPERRKLLQTAARDTIENKIGRQNDASSLYLGEEVAVTEMLSRTVKMEELRALASLRELITCAYRIMGCTSKIDGESGWVPDKDESNYTKFYGFIMKIQKQDKSVLKEFISKLGDKHPLTTYDLTRQVDPSKNRILKLANKAIHEPEVREIIGSLAYYDSKKYVPSGVSTNAWRNLALAVYSFKDMEELQMSTEVPLARTLITIERMCTNEFVVRAKEFKKSCFQKRQAEFFEAAKGNPLLKSSHEDTMLQSQAYNLKVTQVVLGITVVGMAITMTKVFMFGGKL